MCMAAHLFFNVASLFLISLLTQHVFTLIIYDSQVLLNIRDSIEVLSNTNLRLPYSNNPPRLFLTTVPACQNRLPWNFHGRKRRRRRGKRGGIAVELNLSLSLLSPSRRCLDRFQYGLGCGHFVSWHSLKVAYQWILPVTQDHLSNSFRCRTPRLRRRGVNPCNLRSLCCAAQLDCDPAHVRIRLVNARSLVTKTFILQDFFYLK